MAGCSRHDSSMFNSTALEIDHEFAGELAVVCDELFGDNKVPIKPALTYLLAREGGAGVMSTLRGGLERVFALYKVVNADRPLCEASDGLAQYVMAEICGSPGEVATAQVALRMMLDEGSARDLPTELLEEIGEGLSEARFVITLAKLVMGMSAVYSSVAQLENPGDALRNVLEVA